MFNLFVSSNNVWRSLVFRVTRLARVRFELHIPGTDYIVC